MWKPRRVVTTCALVVLAMAISLGGGESQRAHADTLFGYDVSWPQCPQAQGGYDLPMPPTDAAFMIIGLTDGLAFTENPCLTDQVDFATDHGIPAHGYAMATFPTATQLTAHGASGPFPAGTRAGRLRNVGYAEATFALASLSRIGWAPPTIWVDVEPRSAQPWPTGTATRQQENRWVIEGLLRGLHDAAVGYGLYSYTSGWQEITGGWSLPGVPVWATAGRLDYPDEARDRCRQTSFSGGEVHLAQWTDGTRDYNITCGSYQFGAPPLRVFGPDRYATSVAASRLAFPNGSSSAFVATGIDFADALAGGPASVEADGPILLTPRDALPAAVVAELRRLDPTEVYVLGGPTAVSSRVLSALSAEWSVVRIFGEDRYSTASAVAARFTGSSKTAFLAVGTDFADALAGGSAAAANGAPILLTRSDRLSTATTARLRTMAPDRVVVLGGTIAVSDAVVAQVRSTVPGAVVERVSGADRYGTSREVVRRFWPGGSDQAFVATGSAFPDALSAVPPAAANGAPVVLSRPTCVPTTTRSALAETGADLRLLMGGRSALRSFVLDTPC